jgi:general secretion pathway protein G
MEVLVVVAIIVMMAGLALGMMRYLEMAKVNTAKARANTISTAVEAFNLQMGNYPTTLQELTQPSSGMKAFLEPKDIIDPWGKPYQYDPAVQSATGKVKISTVYNGQEISNLE